MRNEAAWQADAIIRVFSGGRNAAPLACCLHPGYTPAGTAAARIEDNNLDSYKGTYEIRWSDLDANGHVNYSAYIDAAGDLRYRFFTEHGYPAQRFLEMGMGPVYTDIRARFLREVRIGETVTITYELAGLSASGVAGGCITTC